MKTKKVYFDKITNKSFRTVREHFEEFKEKSSREIASEMDREFREHYRRWIIKMKVH